MWTSDFSPASASSAALRNFCGQVQIDPGISGRLFMPKADVPYFFCLGTHRHQSSSSCSVKFTRIKSSLANLQQQFVSFRVHKSKANRDLHAAS
jgi:hypothetical protein